VAELICIHILIGHLIAEGESDGAACRLSQQHAGGLIADGSVYFDITRGTAARHPDVIHALRNQHAVGKSVALAHAEFIHLLIFPVIPVVLLLTEIIDMDIHRLVVDPDFILEVPPGGEVIVVQLYLSLNTARLPDAHQRSGGEQLRFFATVEILSRELGIFLCQFPPFGISGGQAGGGSGIHPEEVTAVLRGMLLSAPEQSRNMMIRLSEKSVLYRLLDTRLEKPPVKAAVINSGDNPAQGGRHDLFGIPSGLTAWDIAEFGEHRVSGCIHRRTAGQVATALNGMREDPLKHGPFSVDIHHPGLEPHLHPGFPAHSIQQEFQFFRIEAGTRIEGFLPGGVGGVFVRGKPSQAMQPGKDFPEQAFGEDTGAIGQAVPVGNQTLGAHASEGTSGFEQDDPQSESGSGDGGSTSGGTSATHNEVNRGFHWSGAAESEGAFAGIHDAIFPIFPWRAQSDNALLYNMCEIPSDDRPVTMRDVAAAAGVSPMTVSYALRNHPRVSAATRARIQELAREMHYQVDPDTSRCLARVASRGRGIREAIGFLHYGSGAREQDLQRIAEHRAGERGVGVLGLWLGQEGMNVERAMGILEARGIRGVLIGNRGLLEEVEFPDCGHVAAVELGQTHAGSRLPRVLGNHFGNTRRVLDQVAGAGYSRPGLVCLSHQDEAYLGLLRAAFAVQCLDYPLWVPEVWSSKAFQSWVQEEKPDVIFSSTPQVRAELERYPDLGLVEYHDETTPGKGIATLQEHRKAKIERAVDLVLSRLARGETGESHPPTQTLIDGRWIPGVSLQPR